MKDVRPPRRPSPEEIRAAAGKTVPDVIRPGLKVLFVGINPGLYTAAIGHHFGRPGNRFWQTIYRAGFTPRLLSPYEERELLEYGCGITNIVPRATATAAELAREELLAGGQALVEKIRLNHPVWTAVLGVTAYRSAFEKPKAIIGAQPETIGGSKLWVLPNPSGLNAHYRLDSLTGLFREFYQAAFQDGSESP